MRIAKMTARVYQAIQFGRSELLLQRWTELECHVRTMIYRDPDGEILCESVTLEGGK